MCKLRLGGLMIKNHCFIAFYIHKIYVLLILYIRYIYIRCESNELYRPNIGKCIYIKFSGEFLRVHVPSFQSSATNPPLRNPRTSKLKKVRGELKYSITWKLLLFIGYTVKEPFKALSIEPLKAVFSFLFSKNSE